MDVARFKPENWPLPDLVAFNQRVHDRVDPWWNSHPRARKANQPRQP